MKLRLGEHYTSIESCRAGRVVGYKIDCLLCDYQTKRKQSGMDAFREWMKHYIREHE